jgi:hypothetical protein
MKDESFREKQKEKKKKTEGKVDDLSLKHLTQNPKEKTQDGLSKAQKRY